MLAAIDVLFGVHDSRILVRPGKADLKRRKRTAIDEEWCQIRASEPRVPQTSAGLERFDLVTVIARYHQMTPFLIGVEATTKCCDAM
ncbi:hypothetical protein [Bradyrhizobium sp.]|uniref:hypothetical protein n=1 Tax=Bradyrhizobium sp. TaxID=376 RepID=UPI003C6FA217